MRREEAHTSKRQKVQLFSKEMRLRTATQRESKRQSQGEPGQGKAKQRRSKNQLEKDKIRGGASETARESSPPLIGSRSFSRRPCRAPQSRIQPGISHDWASFDRFGHRSTESFEQQKGKTCSLLVTPVPFLCACERTSAAMRAALRSRS